MERGRGRGIQARPVADDQVHRSRVDARRRRGRFQEGGAHPRRNVRDAEHQPSVPRDAHGDGVLAERQAVHPPSTQGMVQTVISFVRWLDLKPEDIVLVNEYTGGGYGSKGGGSITDIIPALLSKKLNGAPVLMRISREEEHAIGRARPAMHGRMKVGFTKEGRVTAIDMFTVIDGGPYGPGGDGNTASRFASLMFQPETMRWRGVTAITNTPPRGAQSQPGGMQGIALMDPVVTKAARQLGIDQVEIRKMNAPEGKAKFGPANARGERGYVTSCFVKEALDKGAALFKWNERDARGPQRNGIEGARHRRRHQRLQRRLGRVRRSVRHQAGRQDARPDRHRQSRHRIVLRLPARGGGDGRHAVGESGDRLGRYVEEPAVELQLWRQPDDTRDDARGACRRDRRDQEAAADRGQGSRRQTRGLRRGRRARLPQGRRARDDARAGGQARHRARRHLRRPRAAQRHQRDDNALRDGSGRAGADGRGEGQLQARRNDAVFRRRVCRGRSRPRNRRVHRSRNFSPSPTSAP